MTNRTIIFAISEYYNIPTSLAKIRYENRREDNQFEEVIEWYLSKKEEEQEE